MQESIIARNVKDLIKAKGLKQIAVAEAAGYSKNQLNDLLNNRRTIKDVDVIALAHALNVTPNDLFYEPQAASA